MFIKFLTIDIEKEKKGLELSKLSIKKTQEKKANWEKGSGKVYCYENQEKTVVMCMVSFVKFWCKFRPAKEPVSYSDGEELAGFH